MTFPFHKIPPPLLFLSTHLNTQIYNGNICIIKLDENIRLPVVEFLKLNMMNDGVRNAPTCKFDIFKNSFPLLMMMVSGDIDDASDLQLRSGPVCYCGFT